MNQLTSVTDSVAAILVKASTTFRPDQFAAYERAIASESSGQSLWVLRQIVENAKIGQKDKLPLCDDTGIPHLLLELGDEASIPRGFLNAVELGVAKGLRNLPGRPMAVLGSDEERISQSAGLSDDSAALLAAPLQIVHGGAAVKANEILLTVMMYGGGPEIRGKTLPIFHKHSTDVVVDEMIAWAKEGAKLLGCQPCILSFGVGRSNYEAASLSMQAMAKGNFDTPSAIEKRITDGVNETSCGALGLGGDITVLRAFVKVGPQRASGVRVVSMRVGCCFDPRRASVSFVF